MHEYMKYRKNKMTGTNQKKDTNIKHKRINKTFNQTKQKYRRPDLNETDMINKCDTYLQIIINMNHPYKTEMQGSLLIKTIFEGTHTSTFAFSRTILLTIIDLFSRYTKAYCLKDTNSMHTHKLCQLCSAYKKL